MFTFLLVKRFPLPQSADDSTYESSTQIGNSRINLVLRFFLIHKIIITDILCLVSTICQIIFHALF